MQEQIRRLQRVLHTLTQGGLGCMLRNKLKFKFLCSDSLEKCFSGADQLPVSIPYGREVKRVNISAGGMESSSAITGTGAFTPSCPTAWGQWSQLLQGDVEAPWQGFCYLPVWPLCFTWPKNLNWASQQRGSFRHTWNRTRRGGKWVKKHECLWIWAFALREN